MHIIKNVMATLAVLSTVYVVGGLAWVAANEADDREFTGTVTKAPWSYWPTEVWVEIDGVEHILADVRLQDRSKGCGMWDRGTWGNDEWEDVVGEDQVAKVAANMLPVGTKVHGYLANPAEDNYSPGEILDGDRTNIEPISYLHFTSVDDGESVNASIVATGWARAWLPGMALNPDDAQVAIEHKAVLRADKPHEGRPTKADVICGDRERDAERRREERRERRHARHLAELAQQEREEWEDYTDDGLCFCKHDNDGRNPDKSNPNYDWEMDWVLFPENYTSGGGGGGGGYSSGGTPNYCPPGGC